MRHGGLPKRRSGPQFARDTGCHNGREAMQLRRSRGPWRTRASTISGVCDVCKRNFDVQFAGRNYITVTFNGGHITATTFRGRRLWRANSRIARDAHVTRVTRALEFTRETSAKYASNSNGRGDSKVAARPYAQFSINFLGARRRLLTATINIVNGNQRIPV